MKNFWKKHKKVAALIAALIGTPLAGGIYLVTDHILTAEQAAHE